MFPKSFSVRAKLVASFGIMFLLSAALAGASLYFLRAVNDIAREMRDDHLPNTEMLGRIQVLALRQRVSGGRLINADTPELRASAAATLKLRADEMRDVQAAYTPRLDTAEEKALYKAFETQWVAYLALQDGIVMEAQAGNLAQAQRTYNTTMSTGISAVLTELQKLVTYEARVARESGAQAQATYDGAVIATMVLVAIAALMASGAAIMLALTVSRPLRRMTSAMELLAGGDTDIDVPGIDRMDEVGAMAKSVMVFKDNIIRTRALEAETEAARAGSEAQRRAVMLDMADRFEAAVGGIATQVSAAATELQATAGSMSATATMTARRSGNAATAADTAAANVTTVASAAEELGSSVQEIGRQMQGSASLSQRAVIEAAETAALVRDLSESTARIGDVVSLISTIAGQTNLLALNATIEAARAGEAGRGFAVVASEVKALASQTAKATEEITGQIARVQASTGMAVSAIAGITQRIREIDDVSASIAAAVEEQGAATQEIVRNVTEASAGTREVTQNVSAVASAAEETGAASAQVLASASELSLQFNQLDAAMSQFLSTVRAA
ncbi:methyl-accepting chemotaxis protein [Methylobacterium sp. 88A]|uniref:methyl-accepting chemotaxis protein n=1 Tax=Methylobacterium sp. 88A TaxID=1131813 RepID=UPI0004782031|nr:methyl-accepting chemotaxis protein [Methylobacterium sp. 88A]